MGSTELVNEVRLFFITVFGFFASALFLLLLLPGLLTFWLISKTTYFIIRLKLGSTFIRPGGMDIIQGLESEKSRPFINTVARFEGKINVEKFCRRFDDSIINIKNDAGKLRYRKFTQVFEEVLGYHVFRDVDDFDIRKQIKKIELKDVIPEVFNGQPCQRTNNHNGKDSEKLPVKWEKLIERAMDKYGTQPTPPGRPQWEILLLEEEYNHTIVFRIHHSFCDGIYFIRFLLEHVGDTPVECKLPYNYHQPNKLRRFLDYFWAFCLLPYGLFRLSFSYEKNPLHGPELSGDKMFLMSESIPLERLKEVKRATKTSINAILFTCVSNAVAAHFTKKKAVIENIIALIPVSLQDLGRPIKLKNRFGLLGILVPTFMDRNDPSSGKRDPPTAIERLDVIQTWCNRSKSDPSFLAIHWLLVFICSLLPSRLLNVLFKSKGLTTSMSNIVGPQNEDFYFTGAKKTDFMFWVPDRSPLGMGVSVAGFAGRIRIGLMIDRVLMETKQEGYEFLNNFIREIDVLHSESCPGDPKNPHGFSNLTEKLTHHKMNVSDIFGHKKEKRNNLKDIP